MYRISHQNGIISGTVSLTPSKSITNRLLILQAVSGGRMAIQNPATANDSVILQRLLSSSSSTLNAEDAGTAFRFLTAFLACKPGEWLLTGTSRMQERPVGILVEALRAIGADIRYEEHAGYPP